MAERRLPSTSRVWLLVSMVAPSAAAAQMCQVPDGVRAQLTTEAPEQGPYEPLGHGSTPLEGIELGVGHVYHPPDEQATNLPPGADNWLQRVELPISEAVDTAPWGGIVSGWVVRIGGASEPLTRRGLLETGYEELSFVVLERANAWLRIRYAPDGDGAAWIPACALERSPARLAFAAWSDWFLNGELSPLYPRAVQALEVYSGPSSQSNRLAVATRDDVLEPLEIRGEWMRTTLVRPSDYCRLDAASSRVEGWVRWSAEPLGPTLWYFTRGC